MNCVECLLALWKKQNTWLLFVFHYFYEGCDHVTQAGTQSLSLQGAVIATAHWRGHRKAPVSTAECLCSHVAAWRVVQEKMAFSRTSSWQDKTFCSAPWIMEFVQFNHASLDYGCRRARVRSARQPWKGEPIGGWQKGINHSGWDVSWDDASNYRNVRSSCWICFPCYRFRYLN